MPTPDVLWKTALDRLDRALDRIEHLTETLQAGADALGEDDPHGVPLGYAPFHTMLAHVEQALDQLDTALATHNPS